jgi:hypothetical protein
MFEHQIDPIRFKSTSHLIYDTKVFQIFYLAYHKLNGVPCFFTFLLTEVFNLLSCVYKICHFKITFWADYFFGLLDHAYTYAGLHKLSKALTKKLDADNVFFLFSCFTLEVDYNLVACIEV